MSREVAETRLRQDIESAWEPWYASDTIATSKLARRVRDALEPSLIAEFKNAARDLLLKFIETDGIDEAELDQLAEEEMTPHSAEIGRLVADTTEKWVEEDANPERAFSKERAELIAITEITRARTQGEFAAAALLDEIGIPLVGRWYTEEDERVCFPAGTLVSTPGGDIAIEKLACGDLVLTRIGPRRVEATAVRNYTGRMVEIAAGDRRVVSTENHRYWTLEHEWTLGRNVRRGHHLYSVDDKHVEVTRVVNFGLSESNNAIPFLAKTDRHDSPVCSRKLRSVEVYDIQVEGKSEFFANGVLVHNCEICGPLHKTLEAYWSQFFPKGSPAHVRCRCRIDWKEKAKRKPKAKRTEPVGRIRRRARTRSRESVQYFKVIKPTWIRLQETTNKGTVFEIDMLKEYKPDYSRLFEMGKQLALMREQAILEAILKPTP